MLNSSLRGNITLAIELPDDLWPVEADVAEFELALVNIAVNARDAMPDGGTFTISARNVPAGEGRTGQPAGDHVVISFARYRRRHPAGHPARRFSIRSSPPRRWARAPASACRRSTALPTSRAERSA